MIHYLARRLLGLIPLLVGITLITFFVIHLAPGKPTDILTDLNPKISLQVRERLAKVYGLDQPLHRQYLQWILRMVRLDFGRSFMDDRSVWDKIAERIPVTLWINLLAMVSLFLIAVPLGVWGAIRAGTFLDHVTTLLIFIGFAAPTFWLALLLMQFFGIQLRWLPLSGLVSLDYDRMTPLEKGTDLIRHLILPVFVSAFGGLAGVSRYMRASLSEVLGQDYIRTARAKGLSEHQVLYKHALRNALLPIVTILGLSVPGLLGGSVIFETIFAIPGLGRLFYDSAMARDYPVVMGILTIGAVLTLLGNLLADLGYAWVDPRIRISGEK